MDTANQFSGVEKIGSLMRKYAIPCTISLLVSTLYNIVDQIPIANISYPGSYGNAVSIVAFPLTVVALPIAVLVGDGCYAFVSVSPGRSEVNKVRHSAGSAVILVVVSSFMLIAVYPFFTDITTAMFGGTINKKIFHCSQEYLFCITPGIPLYVFGQAMDSIIWTDGNLKLAMIFTLLGAVINIILNPPFIFGFRWDTMGVAAATVLGQIATAALPIWYLCSMRVIRPGHGDFKLARKICKRMLLLGITSFPSQTGLVTAMAIVNSMLRKYGVLDPVFGLEGYAQIPMAMVDIVMKLFQIVILIVVGMAVDYIPIVGYNMDARKIQRVEILFARLLITEAAIGAVALFLAEGFPQQLINILGTANENSYYTEFTIKTFRTYLCMIIMARVNKACFIFL